MKAKKKQETAAPVAAKNLKRTRIEAAAHQLRAAPWNPRPEVTSESVADITASNAEADTVFKEYLADAYKEVDAK